MFIKMCPCTYPRALRLCLAIRLKYAPDPGYVATWRWFLGFPFLLGAPCNQVKVRTSLSTRKHVDMTPGSYDSARLAPGCSATWLQVAQQPGSRLLTNQDPLLRRQIGNPKHDVT